MEGVQLVTAGAVPDRVAFSEYVGAPKVVGALHVRAVEELLETARMPAEEAEWLARA